MTHAQEPYQNADKAILHYQRLIAGHLSPAQRKAARLALIRAVLLRAEARAMMEQIEVAA